MSLTIKYSATEIPCPMPHCRAWTLGTCTVFVGVEAGRWHLSISHPSRDPSWEEIKEARYRFVPDAATMAMLLPPRAEYVNIHHHCFHLYQIDGDA